MSIGLINLSKKNKTPQLVFFSTEGNKLNIYLNAGRAMVI
jgi:hypothetical protein